MFQLTVWSLPPLVALVTAINAYVRARSNRSVPGVHALLLLLSALIFWCTAQLVGSIVRDADAKLLIEKLSYLGIVISPVGWLVFALTYSRHQLKLSAGSLNLISIVPFLTVLGVMTNDWHHLIWTDIAVRDLDGYAGLLVTHGPWFYVHAVYSYMLIVVATTILAFSLSQSMQSTLPMFAVIAAPAIVGATNVFSISPFNPVPWYDFTTLGFAAAAVLLDSCVLRFGLLERKPVVREQVVEQLDDGVAVVTPDGQIVDVNGAAVRLLRVNKSEVLRENILKLVPMLPLADLASRKRLSTEITIGNRAYDVLASTLDEGNESAELVLVFRDMTARREADMTLRKVKSDLELLANTDHLTKLHNRRFFMQRLGEEGERVRRHGSALSVLLYDLDKFKAINDTYGHDAGDLVLTVVAEVSGRIKRVTDIAARIGGEEFALLLPETDQQGAVKLAQRLRRELEEEQIVTADGTEIQVTASVGVATVTQVSEVDQILNIADQALYRAKNGGRNMVCTG